MEKRLAKGNTKFTFHDEKFATELTKYLGLTLKRDSNLRDPIYWALEEGSYPNLDPLKVNLKILWKDIN
jgi:hypothetical protein